MIITRDFYDESKPNALFDIHGTLILDKDYSNHKMILNGSVVNEMLYNQELGKNIVIWTCGTDEEVKETVAVLESIPEKIKIAKIDNETKSMLHHPESVLYDDKTINPLKWDVIPVDVDMPKEEEKIEVIPELAEELVEEIAPTPTPEIVEEITEPSLITEEVKPSMDISVIKEEITKEIKKDISKLEDEIKEIKEMVKKEGGVVDELL